MFEEIEYVDPADSVCDECKCSFGVHLKTCSRFVSPQKKYTLDDAFAAAGHELKRVGYDD